MRSLEFVAWCCPKISGIVLRNIHLKGLKLCQLFTQYYEYIQVSGVNCPYVVCDTSKLYLYNISSGILPEKYLLVLIGPHRNYRFYTCRGENLCSMYLENRRFGRNI